MIQQCFKIKQLLFHLILTLLFYNFDLFLLQQIFRTICLTCSLKLMSPSSAKIFFFFLRATKDVKENQLFYTAFDFKTHKCLKSN